MYYLLLGWVLVIQRNINFGTTALFWMPHRNRYKDRRKTILTMGMSIFPPKNIFRHFFIRHRIPPFFVPGISILTVLNCFYSTLYLAWPNKKLSQILNRNSTHPKTFVCVVFYTHNNKNKTRQPWGRPPLPLLPPMALCRLFRHSAAAPYESSTWAHARVHVRCGRFLCLGHQNGTHQKMGDGRSTGLR